MASFAAVSGIFHGPYVVRRELVFAFIECLFRGIYQIIELVSLLDIRFSLLVFFRMRFGVVDHLFYLFLVEAGRCRYGDILLLACGDVFRRYVEYSISVYVESDLYLGDPLSAPVEGL